MNKLPFLVLLAALLLSSCTPSSTAAPSATEPPVPLAPTFTSLPTLKPSPTPIPANFTITGTVANLADFSSHIDELSILQLVRLTNEGDSSRYTMAKAAYNEDGTTNIFSDVVGIPFGTSAGFKFEVETLAPGPYIVVLQYPYGDSSWLNFMLLTKKFEQGMEMGAGGMDYYADTNQFVRFLPIPGHAYRQNCFDHDPRKSAKTISIGPG